MTMSHAILANHPPLPQGNKKEKEQGKMTRPPANLQVAGIEG